MVEKSSLDLERMVIEDELPFCFVPALPANPELHYESHDTEATIVDKMKCCKSKGRYQAVNLENTNTIEFRIFKGTLNIQMGSVAQTV